MTTIGLRAEPTVTAIPIYTTKLGGEAARNYVERLQNAGVPVKKVCVEANHRRCTRSRTASASAR